MWLIKLEFLVQEMKTRRLPSVHQNWLEPEHTLREHVKVQNNYFKQKIVLIFVPYYVYDKELAMWSRWEKKIQKSF